MDGGFPAGSAYHDQGEKAVEITEVRVKLMDDPDDRLQAFCSITIDDSFVVRDLKIIDGSSGPFVAMPSRKLTSHCRKCRSKNHLRANYCNNCGTKQQHESAGRDRDGRVKLYADIAHPINSECREEIQRQVIIEYENELKLADDPNYVSRYDEGYGESDYDEDDSPEPTGQTRENKQKDSESIEKDPPKQTKTRIESEQAPSGPHVPHPSKKIEKETAESTTKSPAEKSAGDDEATEDSFGAGIFE